MTNRSGCGKLGLVTNALEDSHEPEPHGNADLDVDGHRHSADGGHWWLVLPHDAVAEPGTAYFGILPGSGPNNKRSEGLDRGISAPDFNLLNTQGRTVSLKDFAGQKVLLVFSSPTCPACVAMYPTFRSFSEQEKDIQVVMVSRSTVEENLRLIEAQKFGFPVLARDDVVANDYRVPGTPFIYVIDGQGVVVNKGFASSPEQLETLTEDGEE